MYDIKSRRKELGTTLKQIGDIVGVGRSTVREWEQGIIENMRRDKIFLLGPTLKLSSLLLINDDMTTENSVSTRINQKVTKLDNNRRIKVLNYVDKHYLEQIEEQSRSEKDDDLTQEQEAEVQPYTDKIKKRHNK
ncbi:helix-turn-helix domain-containing protein [Aerococcus urinaeequi]|uniref:helix-turn-helix domain-containing protein n=1 Tax=Aerococcus urinaeequi TaxID=51665 RepID=UPI00288C9453|nr:helix-turn-helix domain-containing protein [Aerococcus urinaeequi]MDT2761045.1 helix-turn-helix domain-containing protein [Aerococcus urinaeequi]